MYRILATTVAALMVMAFANLGWAGQAEKAKPGIPGLGAESGQAEKAVKAKLRQVTGHVTALDPKAKTLTVTKAVKGKPMDYALTITEKTRFKGIKALTDLKIGDKIRVKYMEKGRAMEAKSIELLPVKKAKKEMKS